MAITNTNKFMAYRCLNCDISTKKTRKFKVSDSEELKRLIQDWIAPQSLSDEDNICHECWKLANKALESKDRTRCYGHKSVCIGCGKSTDQHRPSWSKHRPNKLVKDGIPNPKYYHIASQWIAPKQISEKSLLCYACAITAKRKIAKVKHESLNHSINNFCRFCFLQNDVKLSIFDENCDIQQKIEFCFGLQVTNDIDKPTKICISCNSDLNAAFVFKTNFLKADDKISAFLNDRAVKRKLTLTPDSASKEKKIKKEFDLESKYDDVPVPFVYKDGGVKHEVVIEENSVTTNTNILKDYSFDNSKDDNKILPNDTQIKMQYPTPAKVSKPSNTHKLILRTCKTCTKEFTNFAEYRRHVQTHSKMKLKCEKCDEVFSSYKRRKNHRLKHVGAVNQCKHCSYKTHSAQYLLHHMSKWHSRIKPKKPISCKICHEVFPNYRRRDKHFDEEHLNKNWLCNLCNKWINEEKEDHMLLHSAPQFECHDFGHKSYTKENIQAHIMKIHLGIVEPKKPRPRKLPKRREYPCDICKTKFATWQALMSHQKEHRPGYWICPICGAKGKGSLKNHMLRHTAPQLECDYCRKLFYEKGELVRHIKMQHLKNSRKYQCEICSKYMVTKANLKTHQRNVHLKEKNYQCPECGVWKFNKAQLNNHMFKHNGVKDLKCELCDAAYARITYLKNHMLRDHGITVPNCKTSKTVLETSSEFIRRYLISIGRLK